MPANKIVINTENGAETILDLTNDTVTPATLAEGVTAHDASGNVIVGTMPSPIGEITEKITGEFLDDTRLSTSSDATRTATGFVTTPYIDIGGYPDGFTIELSGAEWCTDGTTITDGYALGLVPKTGYTYWGNYLINQDRLSQYGYKVVCDTTTKKVTITTNSVLKQKFKQVRFSGKGTSANAVVEIVYSGNAFDRIAVLEAKIAELEATIESLT